MQRSTYPDKMPATISLRSKALAAVGVAVVTTVSLALPASASASDGRRGPAREARQVQPTACCTPAGANFAKVGGNLGNQDYSSLAKITSANVGQLGAVAHVHLTGGGQPRPSESNPVVHAGVMFLQSAAQDIYAINAVTGARKWVYNSGLAPVDPPALRGVAVGNGLVYSSLPGERVVALNEQTGARVWMVQLGADQPNQRKQSMPAPMTYYNGRLFIGTSNGGSGAARGEVYALNASNGAVEWHFYSTAAPGQTGGGTWAGTSWQSGGGDAWMSPAIDPDLNLVYWALGNPEPRTDGSGRAGKNLFTDSLVALNMSTGALKWYFQSVHHDIWDLDGVMAPVLADVDVHGVNTPVVVYGSKTAMDYVLDRRTGAPIQPVAEKGVPQDSRQHTFATQPYATGDTTAPLCPSTADVTRPVPNYSSGCIFTPFWNQPTIDTPGTSGGTNFALRAFSPKTGLVYLPAATFDIAYTNARDGLPDFFKPYGEETAGAVIAVNPATNRIVWRQPTKFPLSAGSGILATASNLLFEGGPGGVLSARDATSGATEWSFSTGSAIKSTPVTYMVGGRQYVAVFAGATRLDGSVPNGDDVWIFRRGGTIPPAPVVTPPTRVEIPGSDVPGGSVADTVTLGRTWTGSAPSSSEVIDSQLAMAPPRLSVPAGTTVKFVNPAGNTHTHCVTGFFNDTFASGQLAPGQSFTHQFKTKGEFYYNDCNFPASTGVIDVR